MISTSYADYAWAQTEALLSIDSPSGYTAKAAEWVQKVLERTYEFKYNGIKDSYNKGGLWGQELLVIPCENKVVAWQSCDRRKVTPDFTKYAAEYDF